MEYPPFSIGNTSLIRFHFPAMLVYRSVNRVNGRWVKRCLDVFMKAQLWGEAYPTIPVDSPDMFFTHVLKA